MEYYDAISEGYNELHEEEQKAKFRLIKSHLKLESNDTILDVGCGTGLLSGYFRNRIIGLEPSKGMLNQAKKATVNKDFIQGRAEYMPFGDGSFDCVICVSALHNFESPNRALFEMSRVGKKSGAITILKKAAFVKELQSTVTKIFPIKMVLEDERDKIYIF